MKLKNVLLTSLLAVSFVALSNVASANTGKLADPEFTGNHSNRLEFNTFTRVYKPVNYEFKVGLGGSSLDFGVNLEANYVVNAYTLPKYRSELIYGFGADFAFATGSYSNSVFGTSIKATENAFSGHASALFGFKTVASESFDVEYYIQLGLGVSGSSVSVKASDLKIDGSKTSFDVAPSTYLGVNYNQTYSLGLKYTYSNFSSYLIQLGYNY